MVKNIFIKVSSMLMVLFMTVSVFMGCTKTLKEKDVDYAGPMVDNVLAGIKEKDYKKFSSDFSDTMKQAITEDKFKSMVDMLDSKIGEYKEKSFSGASDSKKGNKNFTTVIYKSKYSKESKDVQITVAFSGEEGKKEVEGLFFKSPNLVK